MSVLRLSARLVGFLWMLVLAALGLGIALYCLDALISLGQARPDRLLHLVTARREVGRFLDLLQAPGKVAVLSLLCGVASVMVGLLLLQGLATKPREHLAWLEQDTSGDLAARRRALVQMLGSLAAEAGTLREVRKVKLSLRRRKAGGRVKIDATRWEASEEAGAKRSVEQALDPLAKPFKLDQRISTRPIEAESS